MARKSSSSYIESISGALTTIRAAAGTMRLSSKYRENILRLTDSIEVELSRYETELSSAGAKEKILVLRENGDVDYVEKWQADLLKLHGLRPEAWKSYRDAAQSLYESQKPDGLVPELMRRCGLVDALGLTPAKEGENNG